MAKAKAIYKEIFSYYNIPKGDDKKNRRIRKVIKARLKKAYPSKTWEDLTELEKTRFKLITMKDYMKIESPSSPDTIEKKINQDLSKTLLHANEDLIAHNKRVSAISKEYDIIASVDTMRKSYAEFCDNLNKYYPESAPPSFDEWSKNPHGVFAYAMEEDIYSPDEENYESQIDIDSITQSDIDHVTLQCILRLLEKEFYYIIDTKDIAQCLRIRNANNNQLEENTLQAEYDPSSSIPRERQEQIIQNNLQFMVSNRKLNELDFIHYIEGGDSQK